MTHLSVGVLCLHLLPEMICFHFKPDSFPSSFPIPSFLLPFIYWVIFIYKALSAFFFLTSLSSCCPCVCLQSSLIMRGCSLVRQPDRHYEGGNTDQCNEPFVPGYYINTLDYKAMYNWSFRWDYKVAQQSLDLRSLVDIKHLSHWSVLEQNTEFTAAERRQLSLFSFPGGGEPDLLMKGQREKRIPLQELIKDHIAVRYQI